MSNYVPGICNINPAEIKQRRNAGHFGLASYLVVLVVLVTLNAAEFWYITLFVPAFIAAIGYLQARSKFCVGYASAGMQHADDDPEAKAVADKAKALDQKRARRMNLQASGWAIIATTAASVLSTL